MTVIVTTAPSNPSTYGPIPYGALTGSGLAGGADTNIQFNDDGDLAGSSDLTWDKTAKTLYAAGDVNISAGHEYQIDGVPLSGGDNFLVVQVFS